MDLQKLSSLSDEALKERARNLSFDIAKYYNYQLTKKVQLNSAYGAMGSPYFRFYDTRLASAVTLSGQLVIQWLAKDINQYLNKMLKTENYDYIIAIDTDSLYINMERLVNTIYKNKLPNDKTKIVDFLDIVAEEKMQKVIDRSCEELKDYLNAFSQKMVMKRENIGDKAIWTAKKRYMMNVWDSEGVRYVPPKLKMMGIEAVKSSTPEVCRQKIRDGIKIIMNRPQSDLHKYIAEFKKEFKGLSPEMIAFPRGCNGLKKYADARTLCRSGTPIHVRGALVYNKLLKDNKLDRKYTCIQDSDKVKFLYLKLPNPVKSHVVSMSEDGLPEELGLHNYIDYEQQFEKAFIKPLSSILNAIGWTTERQVNLDDIFGED